MIQEFEIEPGIIASKLDLKEKDTILITIDTDKWTIEDGYSIFKMVSKTFPNNQIVATLKGIEIEKLKEREMR